MDEKTMKLIAKATPLYRKWKGSGPVDVFELRDILKRERKAYESGRVKCSAGCLTDLRADQKTVGQLCKLQFMAVVMSKQSA